MIEFRNYGKTPRLFREIVITEKIDGTNACVVIRQLEEDQEPGDFAVAEVKDESAAFDTYYEVAAQSRNRLITPDNDNAGFARWVQDNAYELVKTLGVGYHYGEWWGVGIQRGYGLDHKRFSLFNTSRWKDEDIVFAGINGLDVVPELYRGVFDDFEIDRTLSLLRYEGSVAAPPFEAEGIIIYHSQSKQVYKVLLENDGMSKTESLRRAS